MINQQLDNWAATSKSREEYLKKVESLSEDELKNKYRPLAAERVIGSLVLNKVAEEEKIEVSAAEIDTEIEMRTQSAGSRQEEQKKLLNNPQSRETLKGIIKMRKTVQRLVEIAGGPSKKNKAKKEAK